MDLSSVEKWIAFSKKWPSLAPPSTPSEQDIFHLIHHIQENSDVRRVVVLGSTPSLRSAIGRIPHVEEIVCVDFSPIVYGSMSQYLGEKIQHERFVECDWLNMSDVIGGNYDYIVGDKSIDNIPLNKWDLFFHQCKASLRKSCILALHVGFPDFSLSGRSVSEIVHKWSREYESGNNNLQLCITGLWEDLLSASYTKTNDFLTLVEYQDELTSFHGSKIEMEVVNEWLRQFDGSWSAKWTAFNREIIENHGENNGFTTYSIKYSSDYTAAKDQPIVLFRSERGVEL